MFNIRNLFNKKTVVTVQLDSNVSLTVEPAVGGARAILIEDTGMFRRQETCWFANINDLIKSLGLTDNVIIRKLSKAF